MIISDYFVKIIDFGMAKKVSSQYELQTDSDAVGTLPYMVFFVKKKTNNFYFFFKFKAQKNNWNLNF